MNPALVNALITAMAVILSIALLVLVVVLLRRRLGIGMSVPTSDVGRLLEAQGSARAMEAIALLRDLSSRAEREDVTMIWFRIAPAIQEAEPTCPPPLRAALRQALTAAAAQCQQKAVAKAMADCAAQCV